MLVQLLPGTRPEALVEILENLENDLGNRQYGNKYELLNNYLRWANEASVQLASMVSSQNVRDWVLTQRHWVLQTLDPTSNEAIPGLLRAEVVAVKHSLQAARNDLRGSLKTWASRPGDLLMVDTNVFLEHEYSFPTPEWVSSVAAPSADKPAHLIIPILVIDELDAAKRDQVRTRARQTLYHIYKIFQEPTATVTLDLGQDLTLTASLLFDTPSHVRLSDHDAELLDRCTAVAGVAEREVRVVTFDTGMALRAKVLGLPVNRLDRRS